VSRKADAELTTLRRRLGEAAAEFKASDPDRFLAWLRQQRRGYDPGHDGMSPLMQLVDDIADWERRQLS
jgi:hypothetical protein